MRQIRIRKPIISDEQIRIDSYLLTKIRSHAWFLGRNFRKSPCPKCGLFGCICQLNLLDWLEPKPKPVFLKDKCPVCDLFLCDCQKDACGNPIPLLK